MGMDRDILMKTIYSLQQTVLRQAKIIRELEMRLSEINYASVNEVLTSVSVGEMDDSINNCKIVDLKIDYEKNKMCK